MKSTLGNNQIHRTHGSQVIRVDLESQWKNNKALQHMFTTLRIRDYDVDCVAGFKNQAEDPHLDLPARGEANTPLEDDLSLLEIEMMHNREET